mmetsp:Transcript_21415/g.45070  ORF Transcript_21415/g.45070 Transcript_21415/m.45070 type:complete len:244 (-) Transcript_21415:1814-2545(-)
MNEYRTEENTEKSTEDASVSMETASEDAPEDSSASEDAAALDEHDNDNDNDNDDESKSVVPDDEDEDGDGDTNAEAVDEEDEETKSMATSNALDDDEEEEEEEEDESKSVGTATNDMETETTEHEAATTSAPPEVALPSPPKKKRGKPQIPASARKGRAPAVKGLNIPFRTVKKAMKLDPDIPIVQNEAAIMTTLAAELFLKRLANQSQKICKNRGKNTIRYEDVADARSNDPALAFLKTIIP